MSREWDADVELSQAAAGRLIERQFPVFAPARLALLGAGWDNTAYLVNDAFVFRFPRRQIAVPLLEREARVMPRLAPHLPLPVPVPRWLGTAADGYPYAFAGYLYVPGTTACQVAWSDAERSANAAALGRFLAALHGIPVGEGPREWAPSDAGRPISPLRDRLRSLAPHLEGIAIEELADLSDHLAAAEEPGDTGASCWVHGDLYMSQLLIDTDRRLCGVIDWGDVRLGSPALDLMIAFSFLPPAARPVFREAYGPIEPPTWDRARHRALYYGVTLMEYGLAVDSAAFRAAGEYALRSAGTG
jgi:aminoglycoside phosphotransferase (APT) family kinase protein